MPHFAGYRLWHSETLLPSPKAFTKQKVDLDFDAQPHTLGELTTPPKARETVPQLGVKLKQLEKD